MDIDRLNVVDIRVPTFAPVDDFRRATLKLIGSLTGLAVLSSFGPSCAPKTSRLEPPALPRVTPGSSAARPSKHDVMDTLKNQVPPEVRSAFPTTATVTLQHKLLTREQITSIETESGATIRDADFHSYVAHDSSGRVVGTATISEIRERSFRLRVLLVLKANFKIQNVTTFGEFRIEPQFLRQFAGKDVKSPLRIGEDLKYEGSNEQEAIAISRAVKRDLLAMEALYGKTQPVVRANKAGRIS